MIPHFGPRGGSGDGDGRESSEWPDDGVVLYDGLCVLCSGWVRFVADRDRDGRFRFTPISSQYGTALARHLGIDPADPDTNAVLLRGRAHLRSDAALAILGELPGWRWTGILRIVPLRARDVAYRHIARNRYRLFGRRESCDIGDGGLARRVVTRLPERVEGHA